MAKDAGDGVKEWSGDYKDGGNVISGGVCRMNGLEVGTEGREERKTWRRKMRGEIEERERGRPKTDLKM